MSKPDYQLPFWMAGPRAKAFARAAERWLEVAIEWFRAAYDFNDAQTVAMDIVDLLAYQRGIDRFRGEPDWLYRLRVHHAYQNWIDAGTKSGMERIFTRLQMPIYDLEERVEGYDWDMIRLRTSLTDYLRASYVLHIVMHAYRRTCRRWIIEVQAPTLTAQQTTTAAALTIAEPTGTDVLARHTSRTTAVALTILEMA